LHSEKFVDFSVKTSTVHTVHVLLNRDTGFRVLLCQCINVTHGIVVTILSVCLSVRLSDACIVTKRNNCLSIS